MKKFTNWKNKSEFANLYHKKEWKELRVKILNKYPFCLNCQDTKNLHVDHIFEHKGNEKIFFCKENLQILCLSCHFIKSKNDKYLDSLKMKKDYFLNLEMTQEISEFPEPIKYIDSQIFRNKFLTDLNFSKQINIKIDGWNLLKLKSVIEIFIRILKANINFKVNNKHCLNGLEMLNLIIKKESFKIEDYI